MYTLYISVVVERPGPPCVSARFPGAGLGEPPSVASAAAIANAVFHALGAPVRHLPITPDKVLAALAARKG